MKRLILFFFLFLAPVASATEQAAPVGTATATVATITVGFVATQFIFMNDSTTDSIWVRLDGGVSTAAAPAVEIKPLEKFAWSPVRNEPGVDSLSIICATGKTAAYRTVFTRQ